MIARDRAGFSLIELLVVVAIIAILAAVLFPIYTNSIKAASRSKCQSNLKQIMSAFESYTADYSGCYPNLNSKCLWMGRYWRWPMKRYLGYYAVYDPNDSRAEIQSTRVWNSVLRCPADPTPGDIYDGTSYGYSAAFFHTPEQIDAMTLAQLYDATSVGFATVKIGSVKYPAKKAMVADWITHTDDKASWWTWAGSRSYLFADGHVVYLGSSRIKPAGDSYPDINLTRHGIEGKDID